jgi:hypothetical protein
MHIQFKKLKKYSFKLMLISNNKNKKIFKTIGGFDRKTYNFNLDYIPYLLKNGAILSNSFSKLLSNIIPKQNKKIKYK